MGRGRPKKIRFDSVDDQLDDIILKLFNVDLDNDGKLVFTRNTEVLNLEDMALIKWQWSNRNTSKPITKVGEMKQEQKLLKTIKHKCNEYGFSDNDLHDLMYDMSNPQRKTLTSRYSNDSVDD